MTASPSRRRGSMFDPLPAAPGNARIVGGGRTPNPCRPHSAHILALRQIGIDLVRVALRLPRFGLQLSPSGEGSEAASPSSPISRRRARQGPDSVANASATSDDEDRHRHPGRPANKRTPRTPTDDRPKNTRTSPPESGLPLRGLAHGRPAAHRYRVATAMSRSSVSSPRSSSRSAVGRTSPKSDNARADIALVDANMTVTPYELAPRQRHHRSNRSAGAGVGNRSTIGRPRASWRAERQVVDLRAVQAAEEVNNIGAWVDATKTWLRKSSSRIAIPARPRPPRRCAR